MNGTKKNYSFDKFYSSYLSPALDNIEQKYFEIPHLEGNENQTTTRPERIFCYELYHQLRSQLGDEYEFDLHGEVSKMKCEFFNKRKIPDFIVHLPGTMNKNNLVIEVKGTLTKKGIEKDVETLCDFMQYSRYRDALLIIFGQNTEYTISRLSNHWFEKQIRETSLQTFRKVRLVIKENAFSENKLLYLHQINNKNILEKR